jgi:hypothetical protein
LVAYFFTFSDSDPLLTGWVRSRIIRTRVRLAGMGGVLAGAEVVDGRRQSGSARSVTNDDEELGGSHAADRKGYPGKKPSKRRRGRTWLN